MVKATPLPNNRFYVQFVNSKSSSLSPTFESFTIVSGIGDSSEIEEIREVTQPLKTIKIPGQVSNEPLVLTRVFTEEIFSLLNDWREEVKSLAEKGTDFYKDVIVTIMNFSGDINKVITFYKCWPVRYSLSNLDSNNPELVKETVELQYDRREMLTF